MGDNATKESEIEKEQDNYLEAVENKYYKGIKSLFMIIDWIIFIQTKDD